MVPLIFLWCTQFRWPTLCHNLKGLYLVNQTLFIGSMWADCNISLSTSLQSLSKIEVLLHCWTTFLFCSSLMWLHSCSWVPHLGSSSRRLSPVAHVCLEMESFMLLNAACVTLLNWLCALYTNFPSCAVFVMPAVFSSVSQKFTAVCCHNHLLKTHCVSFRWFNYIQ